MSSLDDATSDKVGLLLSRRVVLLDRAHAIMNCTAAGQRVRIHGDYHLGQTLCTKTDANDSVDFVILDFEGEPARALVERREKQSPLKDVAGMLRSLSYVAHAGLDQFESGQNEDAGTPERESARSWAVAWQQSACLEFLRAYREHIAANPDLLPSPDDAQLLLNVYLLEKALYELLYELNNRPEWLTIPLDGILAL
jgi:maltose alpha-D-glucosyltransferase/alpha-amylase